jgi:hypothetical protein
MTDELTERLVDIRERQIIMAHDVQETRKDIVRLSEHVSTQNHRIDKLEIQDIKRTQKELDREEWEEGQARLMRWIIATSIALAGLVAAIVGKVMD